MERKRTNFPFFGVRLHLLLPLPFTFAFDRSFVRSLLRQDRPDDIPGKTMLYVNWMIDEKGQGPGASFSCFGVCFSLK